MKFDNNILSELQQLSPELAKLPKTNVFTVPESYFEMLDATILLGLKEDFVTPDDLKFSDVPAGYFENLPANILNKINEQQTNTEKGDSTEIFALLQSVQYSNQFEVPDGYFTNLSSVILDKINEQSAGDAMSELKELSSLLYRIRHTKVYDVPSGYFDTVPVNIVSLVRTTPAKVIRLPKRKSILRYAAAAVITGVMALGVYKYAEKPSVLETPAGVNYVTINASIEKGKNMSEEQFNEAMNNLTKEDIAKYLEKNGTDYDMSLLTPSIDDDELPKIDEYLLDEKTLENYLDKIKFQN
jgi:hypothetical protein